MTLNAILIVLLIIIGVAYFSVRNRRKQRERSMKK
jgi:preprotein translocase subunit YajC